MKQRRKGKELTAVLSKGRKMIPNSVVEREWNFSGRKFFIFYLTRRPSRYTAFVYRVTHRISNLYRSSKPCKVVLPHTDTHEHRP